MKKPANLVYGADEQPPRLVTVISAVQHVGVIGIFMIYPLIIGRRAGLAAEEMGMMALAAATLLQALPRGPVGSRFTVTGACPSSWSSG
jgi:NCS2 family nucleobase:cation symporter-2